MREPMPEDLRRALWMWASALGFGALLMAVIATGSPSLFDATFGLVLTGIAIVGAVVAWRSDGRREPCRRAHPWYSMCVRAHARDVVTCRVLAGVSLVAAVVAAASAQPTVAGGLLLVASLFVVGLAALRPPVRARSASDRRRPRAEAGGPTPPG